MSIFDAPAPLIPETFTDAVSCLACQGEGLDDNDEYCPACGGTGLLNLKERQQ